MKHEYNLWICKKISIELKKLNIEIHYTTVSKIIYTYRKNGYLPISLQYRPYQSTMSREVSIAGRDPLEDTDNRSYEGKTAYTANERDLDNVIATWEN